MKKFLFSSGIINFLVLLGLSIGLPQAAWSQTTVTLGSGTATSSYFPNYYLYNYTYTQTIYTAAELTGGGAAPGANLITKIRYLPNASVSTSNWKDWVVYLGNTSKVGFVSNTDWIALSDLSVAFDGTIPATVTSGTWMEITLATPFVWDGTSNLAVAIDENTPTYGSSPSWRGYTLAPSTGNKGIYYYSDGTNPNPSAPPTGTRTNAVAQIQFVMAPALPCSGTPAAAITSPVTNTCAGVPFTLSATPTGFTGLTYQFQVSTDGGVTWSNLGPASGAAAYTVPSQTVASQYRVIVTCAGGGSDTSAAVAVAQNLPSTCYCTPATSGGSTYYIANFTTTGGIININKTSAGSATGYQDFHTTDSAAAPPGTTINYSIGISSGTFGRAIWVDYNEDGAFSTAEQVASSTSYASGPLTGSFTIPLGTTPGNKRMRVLASYTPSNPSNPCANSGSGEYEDYTLKVVALEPCAGSPVAGTANTNLDTLCPGSTTNLSLSGYSAFVTGINIQWQQSSSPSGPFTDVTAGAGGTTAAYTTDTLYATTYYRAKVTCTNSGMSSYSDTLEIVVIDAAILTTAPAANCITGPVTLGATGTPGTVLHWWDAPTGGTELATGPSFTTPVLTTTTTYYVSASTGSPAVSGGRMAPLPAATGYSGTNTGLILNVDVPFTLNSVDVYPSAGAGTITIELRTATGTVLESSTFSFLAGTGSTVGGGATPVTIPLNFTVPAGTGLRLVAASLSANLIRDNSTSGWTYPLSLGSVGSIPSSILSGSSSTSSYYYFYNLQITTGCESPRVAVEANIGALPAITTQPLGDTLCAGQPLTLSATASGAATYQWYGPGGAIPGATTATYTIPVASLANTGSYSVEAIGAPGCGSAISDIATFSVNPGGQWLGFSSDWQDAANWCGGVPTATTDVVIPNATILPFEPVIESGTTAQVHNLSMMSSTVTVNGELEIYGNLTGSGISNLNAAAGNVILAGAAAQNIDMGFDATGLEIAGGGNKTLANDVTVTGNLNLLAGKVILPGATLTLDPGATLTGGSATSYVVSTAGYGGLKQEVGAGTARFPVGNSAYNPATLSNSGTPDNFTIRVHDAVLEAGYSGAPVAPPTYVVNRTWDISKESSTAANATLTLQWNSGEENSSLFDLSHVYIAHYTAGAWQNTCCPSAELAPAASGSGPYTVSQSGLSSFSPFTVSSAGGAPLSISTASQGSFTIEAYPNPVSDELTVAVKGGSGRQATVSIIDMTGRELMARYVENGRAAFSMKQLAAGVYFVKYSDGQVTQTLKINKQ